MTNRTTLINKVLKVVKKHYTATSPPPDRSLLEHLLYACCLENAHVDAADEAFARLQETFYDWNEIRVTTVTELAETLSALPDPEHAATRLKKCLQQIFESHYAFDIEFLKKMNLGKAVKELEALRGASPFVLAYVTQQGLGGHAIPTSSSLIDLMLVLGVVNEAEAKKGRVPGLERAVPKSKGIEYASLLHQFGAEFRAAPHGTQIRTIAGEIDPAAKERLAPRTAKTESAPAEPKAAKKPRSKGSSKGAAPTKKTAGKTPAKRSATKRSPTKQLSKKKPR